MPLPYRPEKKIAVLIPGEDVVWAKHTLPAYPNITYYTFSQYWPDQQRKPILLEECANKDAINHLLQIQRVSRKSLLVNNIISFTESGAAWASKSRFRQAIRQVFLPEENRESLLAKNEAQLVALYRKLINEGVSRQIISPENEATLLGSYPFCTAQEVAAHATHLINDKAIAQARDIRQFAYRQLDSLPRLLHDCADALQVQVNVLPPGFHRLQADNYADFVGKNLRGDCYIFGFSPYRTNTFREELLENVWMEIYALDTDHLRTNLKNWQRAMEADHEHLKTCTEAKAVFQELMRSDYAKGNYACEESLTERHETDEERLHRLSQKFRPSAFLSLADVAKREGQSLKQFAEARLTLMQQQESPADILHFSTFLREWKRNHRNLSVFGFDDDTSCDAAMRLMFPNTYPLFVGARKGHKLIWQDQIREVPKGEFLEAQELCSFRDACICFLSPYIVDKNYGENALAADHLPFFAPEKFRGGAFPKRDRTPSDLNPCRMLPVLTEYTPRQDTHYSR